MKKHHYLFIATLALLGLYNNFIGFGFIPLKSDGADLYGNCNQTYRIAKTCETVPKDAKAQENCLASINYCAEMCYEADRRSYCGGLLPKYAALKKAKEPGENECTYAIRGLPMDPSKVTKKQKEDCIKACQGNGNVDNLPYCTGEGVMKTSNVKPVDPLLAGDDDKDAEPVDPGASDEVKNDDASPVDPGDNSQQPMLPADTMSQQQMMQGLASVPLPDVKLPSSSSNINFTGGYSPDPGAYKSASDLSSQQIGGNGRGLMMRADPILYNGYNGTMAKTPEQARSNANNGGSSSGGGMSGGSMGNNAGGGNRGGPSNGRRAAGADSNMKSMGTSFFAPGGGIASGTAGSRKTATNPRLVGKKQYKSKAGSEAAALSRLFGTRPGGRQNNLPATQQSYGRGCLDTVFCSMETYFENIDRSPTSDIEPSK